MFRKFLVCLFLVIPASAGTINVSGTATESVKPDVAYVTLEVITTSVDVNIALEENNKKVSNFLDKGCVMFNSCGTTLGRKSKFETANFRIEMQHDSKDYNKIVGFIVSNSIVCTIHKDDLPLIGKFLTNAVNLGINRIGNVNFGVTNTEAIMHKLRVKALQNAKSKAQIFASTADIWLGKPSYISESIGYMPPTAMRSMRSDAPGGSGGSPVPINAGNETISVSVSVVFETDVSPDREVPRIGDAEQGNGRR